MARFLGFILILLGLAITPLGTVVTFFPWHFLQVSSIVLWIVGFLVMLLGIYLMFKKKRYYS